jgi:hypothetical protein
MSKYDNYYKKKALEYPTSVPMKDVQWQHNNCIRAQSTIEYRVRSLSGKLYQDYQKVGLDSWGYVILVFAVMILRKIDLRLLTNFGIFFLIVQFLCITFWWVRKFFTL